MRALICAGSKTEAVITALSKRFNSSGDAIKGAVSCDEIHEKFMLGETFDRVVVFEAAITNDGEAEISEVTNKIKNYVSNAKVRSTDETVVFIIENKDIADIIVAETFDISDKRTVVCMEGPYKVTFIAKMMIMSVEEIDSEMGYRPEQNEEEIDVIEQNSSEGSYSDVDSSEEGCYDIENEVYEIEQSSTDDSLEDSSEESYSDTDNEEVYADIYGDSSADSKDYDEELADALYDEGSTEEEDTEEQKIEEEDDEEYAADTSLYSDNSVDEIKDIRYNKVEYLDGRVITVGELKFCTKCGEKFSAGDIRKVYNTGRCPKCMNELIRIERQKEEEVDQSVYSEDTNDEFEDDIQTIEVSNQLKSVMKLISKKGYTICFTGCGGSGVTVTAFNTANMISSMGYSVLLVDLDTYSRAQGYLSSKVYRGTGVSGVNLIEAVNSDMDIMSSVVVVKRGLHALTLGIGEDLHKPSEILKEEQLAKFITKAKTKYDFIVLDTKFEDLVGFLKPVMFVMDDIVAVVEDTKRGIIKYMLEMTNIDSEDVQTVMFSRQKVVINRYRGTRDLLGYKIRKASELMKTIDKIVTGITGCEQDIFFRDIPIIYSIPEIPEMEKFWFDKKQLSDTRKGKELYSRLVANILMKEKR